MKKAIGSRLAVLATFRRGSERAGKYQDYRGLCGQRETARARSRCPGHTGDRRCRLPRCRAGSWAKYSSRRSPNAARLKVKFVLGDTPVEQGPAPAQALAQKYVADKSVLVVLGPSTSAPSRRRARRTSRAKIAHISPSFRRARR